MRIPEIVGNIRGRAFCSCDMQVLCALCDHITAALCDLITPRGAIASDKGRFWDGALALALDVGCVEGPQGCHGSWVP